MNGHPGGQGHTRHMLELAALPRGARILDLGAGAGETLRVLRGSGFDAVGIDLVPRAKSVERGDLLRAPFPDGSFDAVISQCAFFVSGNQPDALREACRLLRPGGKLLLSDLFFDDPAALLRAAGFALLCAEELTPLWREYYFDALWRGDAPCCEVPRGKSSYWLLIAQKEEQNGSL